MKVSYELTMPNNNAWNGRWRGSDRKYYVIKTYLGEKAKAMKAIFDKENGHASWYYNFGDGWGANVRMEIIDAYEAKKRQKVSSGFSGYEWMINEIETYGYILGLEERRVMRENKSYVG